MQSIGVSIESVSALGIHADVSGRHVQQLMVTLMMYSRRELLWSCSVFSGQNHLFLCTQSIELSQIIDTNTSPCVNPFATLSLQWQTG